MNRVEVPLSRKEMDVYERLKQELVTNLDGEEIDAVNAAVLSNKLSQLANGAVYGEAYGEAEKRSHSMSASWMPWRT